MCRGLISPSANTLTENPAGTERRASAGCSTTVGMARFHGVSKGSASCWTDRINIIAMADISDDSETARALCTGTNWAKAT